MKKLLLAFVSLLFSTVVFGAAGPGTCVVAPVSAVNSSTGNTFTFTFTNSTGAWTNGSLAIQLPVPGDVSWTAMSGDSGDSGFISASVSGGSISSIAIDGYSTTITVVTLSSGGVVTMIYGDKSGGGAGVTAPDDLDTIWEFNVLSKASAGEPDAVAALPVVTLIGDPVATATAGAILTATHQATQTMVAIETATAEAIVEETATQEAVETATAEAIVEETATAEAQAAATVVAATATAAVEETQTAIANVAATLTAEAYVSPTFTRTTTPTFTITPTYNATELVANRRATQTQVAADKTATAEAWYTKTRTPTFTKTYTKTVTPTYTVTPSRTITPSKTPTFTRTNTAVCTVTFTATATMISGHKITDINDLYRRPYLQDGPQIIYNSPCWLTGYEVLSSDCSSATINVHNQASVTGVKGDADYPIVTNCATMPLYRLLDTPLYMSNGLAVSMTSSTINCIIYFRKP